MTQHKIIDSLQISGEPADVVKILTDLGINASTNEFDDEVNILEGSNIKALKKWFTDNQFDFGAYPKIVKYIKTGE